MAFTVSLFPTLLSLPPSSLHPHEEARAFEGCRGWLNPKLKLCNQKTENEQAVLFYLYLLKINNAYLRVACELYPSSVVALCLDPYCGLGLALWVLSSIYSRHQPILIPPGEVSVVQGILERG